MPDVAMHHYFGQEVFSGLPAEIQKDLTESVYTFGLYGPDPWFTYQIWKPRREGRGRRMHTTKTGAFLMSLARHAREGTSGREMFSYLAGFLCHYALDSVTHPYIIWQTTETWPTKRAHRDLEHALDIRLLQREGFQGGKHDLTDHHFPPLRLPEKMRTDLDKAYREVYGWKNCWAALNRCYRLYRLLFRIMEMPRSPLTMLVDLFPTPGMKSLPHAKCAFLNRDVENLSHQPWHEPFAREMTFTESFPELYAQAVSEAVRMITACHAWMRREISGEELARCLGNRSYLSGLDVNDPRNFLVRSLQPPKEKS